MAKKMNSYKASQEARSLAVMKNRQPVPLTAALYLEQLRPHTLKVTTPRQRQQIAVQVEEQPQKPCVVKIIQPDSI